VHDRFVNQGYVRHDRAITVLNGVPIPKAVNRDWLKNHARQELGLSNDALVIGTVGRLVELKNQAILIELLPRMLSQFPQLKVVIIGGGPLQGPLEELAKRLHVQDHVVFAGQRKNVGQLLYAFDVFALPSLTEGLSIALLEAAAAGLPIAATNVGGNPEIVKHMETGLLMNAADKESTESVLATLLGNPNTRARLADQAAHWVKENASIESMCDAYDRLYLDALKARA
jgi:glycosyltransferase involved in cell wall biosynthesis